MTDIQTPIRPAAQSIASLRQYVPKRMTEPTEALDGPPKKRAKAQKKSKFTGFKLKKTERAPKAPKASKAPKVHKAPKSHKKANMAKKAQALNMFKLARAPKPPKAPKALKAPKAPKAPKVVRAPKVAKISKPKKAKLSVDRRRQDRRQPSVKSVKPKKVDFSFQSLNKYLRFSYLSLFLLVFVFGGWTILAKIQGAVIASGQIAVEGSCVQKPNGFKIRRNDLERQP